VPHDLPQFCDARPGGPMPDVSPAAEALGNGAIDCWRQARHSFTHGGSFDLRVAGTTCPTMLA
jgi:hypothetical protein